MRFIPLHHEKILQVHEDTSCASTVESILSKEDWRHQFDSAIGNVIIAFGLLENICLDEPLQREAQSLKEAFTNRRNALRNLERMKKE